MSITALPVIAKILMDLNMLKSDLGMLVMSSAMVNDLLGWIGFAMVLALMAQGEAAVDVAASAAEAGQDIANNVSEQVGVEGAPAIGLTIGLTLLFVGLMLTAGKALSHRILPFVQAYSVWPGGPLAYVLVAALLGAAVTEHIGIHSIFGAFIVGVAIGDSSRLRQRTRDHIEQFVNNFFAPVFFASIGLRVNFLDAFDPLMVVIVLVVAIVGKLFGCYAGAKLAGMSGRESWAVGVGMCARGAMEIILGQLALSYGLITEELFVAIVIMALVTSMLPGPLMQWLLQRKQPKKLADVLYDRGFLPRLQARSRQDAISELAAAAADVSDLSAEDIYRLTWQREQLQSTGLGHELAVPHARLPGLKNPVVAVGLSEHGIDFDAPDGEPARVICLLVTSADEPLQQIELLQIVARSFSPPEARAAVLQATTPTELRAALQIAESDAAAEH